MSVTSSVRFGFSTCRLRRLVLWIGVPVLMAILLLLGIGDLLSRPAHRAIGPPPADLQGRSVVITGSAGESVAGWFAEGARGSGAVLLLHGIRSDRRQMLDRSKVLHRRGYSVLLLDLPGHGESSGARLSFGFREALGVRAGMGYLEQVLPGEKIAVIGVSLGAASFVLADVTPPPSAVVLESMYPTIEEAVADRLRIRAGELGAIFAPLLLAQLPLRLGVTPDQLRPIDRVASIRAPVMIAAGTEDRHTPAAETLRLFGAAAQPKELWLVEGAAHGDLYSFDPGAYDARVFAFLAKHLRGGGHNPAPDK